MSKKLEFTYFGNPILREKARELSIEEIQSDEIQGLIENMYFTLKEEKTGVGLALLPLKLEKA